MKGINEFESVTLLHLSLIEMALVMSQESDIMISDNLLGGITNCTLYSLNKKNEIERKNNNIRLWCKVKSHLTPKVT